MKYSIKKNPLEIKRGIEFFKELPKKKQKEFRKAYIKAGKRESFQSYLNRMHYRQGFFAKAFHFFGQDKRNFFYWFFRATGNDILRTHELLVDEVRQFNISHEGIGFLGEFILKAKKTLSNVK